MHWSDLKPAEIVAIVAGVNLLVTIGGLGFAWGMLSGKLKTIEAGQDAIWSEIMSIKKALGLANGGPSKFVERPEFENLKERIAENKDRLDGHSERLRTIEIRAANGGHET